MIKLDWQGMEGEIGALMARYNELPRHIAKKHLKAAIKRAGRDGVPRLKANTPVRRSRRVKNTIVRGQFKENVRRNGGALRRAAMVNAKYYGRNSGGYAAGTLGYKFGWESRKAIWLEFGTKSGVAPREMVGKTMRQWSGPLKSRLEAELAAALEKAVAEVAGGMNPARKYSAGGSWTAR